MKWGNRGGGGGGGAFLLSRKTSTMGHTPCSVKGAQRIKAFDFTLYWRPEFIYLFGVLRCFQHCPGHITMGSFVGRGNRYIQLVKILYV